MQHIIICKLAKNPGFTNNIQAQIGYKELLKTTKN